MLFLPPQVSPIQVIWVPIFYKDQLNQLSNRIDKKFRKYKQRVRTHLNDHLQLTPAGNMPIGWKGSFQNWIRIQIYEWKGLHIVRRDHFQKLRLNTAEEIGKFPDILE